MMSAKLKNVFEIVPNLIDIPDCFYSAVSFRDCGSIKTSLFLAAALILFFLHGLASVLARAFFWAQVLVVLTPFQSFLGLMSIGDIIQSQLPRGSFYNIFVTATCCWFQC